MEVKVFLSSEFKESCPEEKVVALANAFKEYKKTGIRPADFGRDATYDFPSSVKQAGMSHIHLKDSSSKRWTLRTIDYNKTSNTALIYCQGFFDKNKYLLLGFLERAHETYKENSSYLPQLAEIAEQFRTRF